MPSQLHEILVALLREQPQLALLLLQRALGMTWSLQMEARAVAETFSEVEPAEYRADAVFELWELGASKPARALIVEVQLRPDPSKRLTWPAYQAGLRRRLRCPVMLVVLLPSARTAEWAIKPIDLDGVGGSVVRPHVIGPENIPVLAEPDDAARSPELSVLSVLAHGQGEHAENIGRAALSAIERLDDDRAKLYADLVFSHLSEVARAALENEMDLKNYEYQSDFARKYIAKGKVEGEAAGKAEAVLLVLRTRGLAVDETLERRVRAQGLEQLDALLVRATSVASVDDLFDA